jgi:hypothetical protein
MRMEPLDLEAASDAYTGVETPSGRNDFELCPGPGTDLRSKLPDLSPDLWQGRQLHRVSLYIHGPM